MHAWNDLDTPTLNSLLQGPDLLHSDPTPEVLVRNNTDCPPPQPYQSRLVIIQYNTKLPFSRHRREECIDRAYYSLMLLYSPSTFPVLSSPFLSSFLPFLPLLLFSFFSFFSSETEAIYRTSAAGSQSRTIHPYPTLSMLSKDIENS